MPSAAAGGSGTRPSIESDGRSSRVRIGSVGVMGADADGRVANVIVLPDSVELARRGPLASELLLLRRRAARRARPSGRQLPDDAGVAAVASADRLVARVS